MKSPGSTGRPETVTEEPLLLRRYVAAAVGVALLSLTAGCNFTKLAANQTVDVFNEASASVQQESDPVLAETAVFGNLKVFEGLLKVVPENELLLRMNAEAFSSYVVGFLQPKTWGYSDPFDPTLLQLKAREKDYLTRAKTYALRRVELMLEDVAAAIKKGKAPLKKALQEDFDEEELDALFWLAHCWGLLVQSDTDDLENMADLETAELIMARVIKSDPGIEDGQGLIFAGMSKVMLGAGLAGDLSGAEKRLKEAIEVTEGKFLAPQFFYGRYYCAAILDKDCFTKNLQAVVDADPDEWMQRRLTNVLAQSWARYWLTRTNDIF